MKEYTDDSCSQLRHDLFKTIFAFLLGGTLITISNSVLADYYIPNIINPANGYILDLSNDIDEKPSYGPQVNGRYYQLGKIIKISSGDFSGNVKCVGDYRITDGQLPILYTFGTHFYNAESYHRLFIMQPSINIIEGRKAYQINNNLFYTIESENNKVTDNQWTGGGFLCANEPRDSGKIQNISNFDAHLPLYFRFYVVKRFVDNVLQIPATDLGGYVRAFSTSKSDLPTSYSMYKSTAPIRLKAATLRFDNSCKALVYGSETNGLTLNHSSALNASNFNDTATAKITYKCDFSTPENINFSLDYTTHGSDLRLPLTNANGDVIYSTLTMSDGVNQSTLQNNRLKINVSSVQTLTIKSELVGKLAKAGSYSGSAWLIATFD